jgi:hypothetical protein
MLLDVIPARINRPDRIRDFTTDKFVVGIAGPEGDIGLALGQVEVSVARYEFNSKVSGAGSGSGRSAQISSCGR